MPSEYDTIPYEVEEITSALEVYLDANLPGMLEGALLGEWYYASDDILAYADTEETHTDADWTLYKEIEIKKCLRSDTIFRIKFDLHGGGAGKVAHGRIYKNGAAIGIDQIWQYVNYNTKTEDFPDLAVDDKIQLWGYITGGGTGYWRNFRICGKSDTFIVNED